MQIPLSLYWRCQIIGWSVASVYWGYSAFLKKEFNLPLGLADFAMDVLIGIGLTHLYRNFVHRLQWHKLDLKSLVPRILPVIVLLSGCYMLLIVAKLFVLRFFLDEFFNVCFYGFFRANAFTVFITGTRLLSIWVLAYHLYHYAQREINTTRENARLLLIAKEAQLSNLSAQLNPHFFFNSLNNIKFLVTNNPVAARRSIDLLADLLRNSLYGKGDPLIPVREEIALVKDYMELEKLRLEERLNVSISVNEELADALIPPLSIQALVENAIKHGIDKRKEGGIISVNVMKKDNFINIRVQNSGSLAVVDANTGLGLRNLRERLRLQYNEKAVFSISASSEEDTVLSIILIPLP